MTPLQTELAKPEYAALSDADAAARLNAPIVVGRRAVPLAEFVHRLFGDATWATLQAAAGGSVVNPPAPLTALQVRMAAATVYDFLRNPHVEAIDMDLPATKAALAALIAAGVFAQPLIDGIDALANATASKAAALGIPVVLPVAVGIARSSMKAGNK